MPPLLALLVACGSPREAPITNTSNPDGGSVDGGGPDGGLTGTGFRIIVRPPSSSFLTPGEDYNKLVAMVDTAQTDAGQTLPIEAQTPKVDGNYEVTVVLSEFDATANLTVSLKSDVTPIKSRIKPGVAVHAGQITLHHVDFSEK